MITHVAPGASHLGAISYDDETQVLSITFKGTKGKRYEYDNVPLVKFEALAQAEHPGTYFHAEIKPHHACRTIEIPIPDTDAIAKMVGGN